jgi:hypothetical protein
MKAAVDDALKCVKQPTPAKNLSALAVPVTASATVRSFMEGGTHALAQSADGRLLTIDGAKTIADVRLDWVVHEGQVVTGVVPPGSTELDLTASVLRHRFGEVYRHGQTVLALAHDVTKDSANLTLFPGSTWPVHILGTTEGVENPLASEGEVVCALFYTDKGAIKLSLANANPDAVITAPPLIKGGQPWLVLGRDLAGDPILESDNPLEDSPGDDPAQMPSEDDQSPVDEDQAEMIAPSDDADNDPPLMEPPRRRPEIHHQNPAEVSVASRGIDPNAVEKKLEASLRRIQKELDVAYKESNQLRVQLSQALVSISKLQADNSALKKRQRTLARAAEAAASSDELFLDPKDALRHEIYSIWASYIPAEEKERYPAPRGFEIGDALPESLNKSTDAATREKALETIVDLLVWREERKRSLVKKPLRTGSGSKPQLMRADGSTAWRVRVENHTSQALRMMYWQRPDKTIELATVNIHDNYTVQ